MAEIVGPPAALGWVAVKAVLLFATVVLLFPFTERRTLAELRTFDFVVAAATGAILGRGPGKGGNVKSSMRANRS